MICEEQVQVGGRLPTYDLLLRWRLGMAQAVPTDQAADTGVAVMVTFNANSLAAKYRRLSEAPRLPGRLIVLRDERIPEVLGAAGQRYRDGLEAKPGCRIQFVDIGPEEYAELTALEAVLADSRSGDLEIDKSAGGANEAERARCPSILRAASTLSVVDADTVVAGTASGGGSFRRVGGDEALAALQGFAQHGFENFGLAKETEVAGVRGVGGAFGVVPVELIAGDVM